MTAPSHSSERDLLVERHLPLARRLAARYRGREEPFDDLFQAACVGLVKAAGRFDPARGTAFPAYAMPTILGEIRRHFRDHTWAVRVPRDQQELFLRAERARDELTTTAGREPTLAELARYLGADEESLLGALELQAVYRSVPLEGPPSDDPDAVHEGPGTLDHGYEQAEDRVLLDRLLDVLTPRETEILRLRFEEDLTQQAIGQRVGVSQMHVSRVLLRSLARLRDAAADRAR